MSKALRKSWQEKLADSKDLPRVVEINERMSQRWGTGTCVIPAPMEVDDSDEEGAQGQSDYDQRDPFGIGPETPCHHRLSHNHRDLCWHCRPGGGGSGGGGQKECHSILADAEIRR